MVRTIEVPVSLGVANRDLGTIQSITDGVVAVRMDGKAERTVKI